jgi:hypothetical protein
LQEKAGILIATARARVAALFSELLFHAEFRHRAPLTPTQELEAKIFAFEQSAARFQTEGETLSDPLAGDRRRMISQVDDVTNALRSEAHAAFRAKVGPGPAERAEEGALRAEIAQEITAFFETAFKSRTEQARQNLIDALSARQANVAALIAKVRETAAGLMAITAATVPPEDAFALWREPYWVAPAPANAISNSAALAIARLLPRALWRHGPRKSLIAGADRATLRNVGNLSRALRNKVEEAFRKFASLNFSKRRVHRGYESAISCFARTT